MKRNYIHRHVYRAGLLALLVLLVSSCEKYLSIDAPDDTLSTPNVFADSASAALAITGIYSSIMGTNTGFIGCESRWAGLCSDELESGTTTGTYLQFAQNNLLADNSLLTPVWTNIYTSIYQVNSVMEGTESSPSIAASAKQTLIAEARFIRAWLFFYAASYWGDVPLTLSTDYRVNQGMPRTAVTAVYQQVIADLKTAVAGLPAAYPTADRARPNQMAALALLARVYLYTADWQKAEEASSLVIGSGAYLPLPPPAAVFLKDSRETIWQLYPATSGGVFDTYEGYYYVPSSLTNQAIPTYLISADLFTSFENGDSRKNAWIGVKASAGNTPFPNKYQVRTRQATQTPREYTIVLRLAEQYLIRAEARVHLGDRAGAVADLNVIRARAGLGNLSADPGEEVLLQAVAAERRHELFCEWGHRWFDLRRTGTINTVLAALKGNNWQPEDAFWPVPADQLLANPSLVQNKGY